MRARDASGRRGPTRGRSRRCLRPAPCRPGTATGRRATLAPTWPSGRPRPARASRRRPPEPAGRERDGPSAPERRHSAAAFDSVSLEAVRIAMLLQRTSRHDNRVLREARALAAAGHEVTIVELAPGARSPRAADGGYAIASALPPPAIKRLIPFK